MVDREVINHSGHREAQSTPRRDHFKIKLEYILSTADKEKHKVHNVVVNVKSYGKSYYLIIVMLETCYDNRELKSFTTLHQS